MLYYWETIVLEVLKNSAELNTEVWAARILNNIHQQLILKNSVSVEHTVEQNEK